MEVVSSIKVGLGGCRIVLLISPLVRISFDGDDSTRKIYPAMLFYLPFQHFLYH